MIIRVSQSAEAQVSTVLVLAVPILQILLLVSYEAGITFSCRYMLIYTTRLYEADDTSSSFSKGGRLQKPTDMYHIKMHLHGFSVACLLPICLD